LVENAAVPVLPYHSRCKQLQRQGLCASPLGCAVSRCFTSPKAMFHWMEVCKSCTGRSQDRTSCQTCQENPYQMWRYHESTSIVLTSKLWPFVYDYVFTLLSLSTWACMWKPGLQLEAL
jgi:hypothetical protein